MGRDVFKQVRRFVHEATRKPLVQIMAESSLYLDLEIDAASCVEFFERFAAEFEIELAGVDLSPYFLPQSHAIHDGIVGMLFAAFVATERHRRAGVKPLLVNDLVSMAKNKRWCV